MFELTEDKWKSLRCQFGTLKKEGRGQHSKYLPYAFTEQGVAMLSGLLNSDVAIDMNIKIMRAFVFVRLSEMQENRQLSDKLRPKIGFFYRTTTTK